MSGVRAPAVERLLRVVVGVPDPRATAAFLTDGLGFGTCERDDGWHVACQPPYGDAAPETALVLAPAERLSLREVTFACADVGALRARLRDAGVESTQSRDALRFEAPSGLPLACVQDGPPAERLAAGSTLAPRRLGHVNLIADPPAAAASFFAQTLGLRLSEQIGENLYFLRIGSEHHNVGLRGGAEPGLHHLGFEMAGWAAYPAVLDQLAALGHQVEYGPGRHGPGRNVFVYLREPSSGLRLELFCDMVQLDEGHVPKRWEAGDRLTRTLNRWGPGPPQSFLE